MQDFKDPNSVQNVYVKIGKPLSFKSSPYTSYQFQLITFQNTSIEVGSIQDQDVSSVMKQTSQLIVFDTMNDASSASQQYVYASVWTNELSKYPSGIVTKNYTIIPQVVIIQKQLDGIQIDNGVDNGKDKNKAAKGGVDWKTEDTNATRTNLSTPDEFGIINTKNLNFFAISSTSSSTSGSTSSSTQDKNIKLSYTLSRESNFSYALMFDFVGALQLKDGMENPGVEIGIKGDANDVVFVSKGSQVIVTLSGMSSVTGSVTSSTVGYNVPHIKNNVKIKPTTIFIYPIYNSLVVSSNLGGSIKQQNGVAARVSDKTLNAIAVMSPSLANFPSGYSESSGISVNGPKFNFTNSIKVTWINSYGLFCYCPITFAETVSFKYYFFGQVKKPEGTEGVEVSYYAHPIFTDNGSGYSMSSSITADSVQSSDIKGIWKFSFLMSGSNKGLQLTPGEMFGFIKVQKKHGTLKQIINGDGKYSQSFDSSKTSLLNIIGKPTRDFSDVTDGWSEYITNVQTSVNFEGMSGSITLDKYAMKSSLKELPEQNIGAITLQAFGGAYDTFTGNTCYGTQDIGLIFKGYALQTSNNVTENSATMNVTLVGVQKKLDDIKLINAPFWDGDKFKDVITYFQNYTCCNFEFNDNFGTFDSYILPRSDNYQKPAINFSTGTSCLQAVRTVAEKCDLKMVIQPNGHIYFYETDEQFIPYYVKGSDVIKSFDETQIISFDISPSLQNCFNSYATMGFLTTSTQQTQFDPTEVGTIPGVILETSTRQIGFDFPWSRVISQVIPGWVTESQLQRQHAINKKRGRAQIYQGSVTVAGISNLFLYDKIKIGGLTYFITGINQNIDLQNKTWTTQLNIARYYS